LESGGRISICMLVFVRRVKLVLIKLKVGVKNSKGISCPRSMGPDIHTK
jgi:hypothetical protein